MHPNEQAHRAIIAAFSAGDVATAGSYYTDDAMFHINGRGPVAGDHRGFGAFVEMFAAMASTIDSYEQQVLDVIGGDEHSVGLLKTVMTRGDEILESDVVSVLTWRDGKVVDGGIVVVGPYAPGGVDRSGQARSA